VATSRPSCPTCRGSARYGSTAIVPDARYRSGCRSSADELEAITAGRCEVVAADLAADRVVAILVYPVRQAAEVRALLGGRDIEEVTLPEALAGVPFEELVPRLDAESGRITAATRDVDRALDGLRAAHGPRLAALRLVLVDRAAEARALHGAALSDHLVVVSGWVPADRLDGLRAALAVELGPAVAVTERGGPDRPGADVPVSLVNGRIVRPFEPLASFVGLPRYGTIDPTPLIALTLPAFIGLMVGDAGYGLVLLVLLVLARRRWRDSRAMAIAWPIGLMAAVATIAFGILFGEWFGDAGRELLGIEPVWMDRAEAVIPLLVLALSIGVVHVSLGLLLGVRNALTLRHRSAAVGRAALLVGLLATLVAVAARVELLPLEAGVLAVVAVVAALLVSVVALGMAGPIEMLGAIGNVLSYARLMAIGLASVMLAVVANRLGGLPENVLVGALVAIVIHALNIGLGFFDSTVQGLRLHYVEFFGRFVEPGGIPYAPFVSVLGMGGDADVRVGRS
jgi:V/A-type H+-transporting ATPase subunit I